MSHLALRSEVALATAPNLAGRWLGGVLESGWLCECASVWLTQSDGLGVHASRTCLCILLMQW